MAFLSLMVHPVRQKKAIRTLNERKLFASKQFWCPNASARPMRAKGARGRGPSRGGRDTAVARIARKHLRGVPIGREKQRDAAG
jgi:hypothetical protein